MSENENVKMSPNKSLVQRRHNIRVMILNLEGFARIRSSCIWGEWICLLIKMIFLEMWEREKSC